MAISMADNSELVSFVINEPRRALPTQVMFPKRTLPSKMTLPEALIFGIIGTTIDNFAWGF